MNDTLKTTGELIAEINELRRHIDELEHEKEMCRQELEDVKEREHRLRLITDNMSELMRLTDLDGSLLYLSPSHEYVLGYTPDERKGRSVFEFLHPDDLQRIKEAFEKGVALAQPGSSEYRIRHKDGHYIWMEAIGKVVSDAKGTVEGTLLSSRDITMRKEMEESLRVSENLYRTIFDSTGTGMLIIEEDMTISLVNAELERMTGYTRNELEGKRWVDFVSPSDASAMTGYHEMRRTEADTVPESYEFRFVDKAGVAKCAFATVALIPETRKTIASLHDITEKKKMEEALQASEEKYRLLIENVGQAIFVAQDGVITFANPAMMELSGFSRDTLINQPFITFIHPDDRQMVIENHLKRLRGQELPSRYHFRVIDNSSRVLWVELSTVLVNWGGRPATLNFINDITERREAEEVLKESERKYREFAEFLPQMVFELDSKGNITFANEHAFEIFGYNKKDIERGLQALQILVPEDRKRAARNINNLLQEKGTETGNEYTAMRKDGTTLPVIIYATPIINKETPTGLRGIIIDMTERKQLESQLLEARKMEAVGTLAGGIAHDFNNILMGIQGYASLMLFNLESDHPHYTKLKKIESQVTSGADLTRQLLGFAQRGRYDIKTTDLNDIVGRSSAMFGRTKKELSLYTKLQQDLWVVEVDQGQIEQMLLNLFLNAWQAMPEGGSVHVETRNVFLNEKNVKPYNIKTGKYVRISVTDTGMGMDKATRDRIFEPFFTTKQMGRGIGLGLASAYGIARGHGGVITVKSKKEQGTTFYIYLPASQETVTDSPLPAEDIVKGHETILLVDDEELVLKVTMEILQTLGYRVFVAGGGEEAIDVFRANQEEIDMVILDMIMPGIGGEETYDSLKDIKPDVKVILSSGYSIDGKAKGILDRGCNAFLQKPFNIRDLSQKVRQVLEMHGS